MALAKSAALTSSIVRFCEWAAANGYQVGEMPPWGIVHRVHSKNSYHYARDGKYGQAADINWPGGGAPERARLITAVSVAESLGLAVRYSLYGHVVGHDTHLHVDVGNWSNLGRGEVKRSSGDGVTSSLQAIVHAATDNSWGPDTDARLMAVREASTWRGNKFPYGVKFAQSAVGAGQDGDWGKLSRAAHDRTVNALERVLKASGDYKGNLDYLWGPLLDKAWAAARARYHR